jgi:hypothetical protein
MRVSGVGISQRLITPKFLRSSTVFRFLSIFSFANSMTSSMPGLTSSMGFVSNMPAATALDLQDRRRADNCKEEFSVLCSLRGLTFGLASELTEILSQPRRLYRTFNQLSFIAATTIYIIIIVLYVFLEIWRWGPDNRIQIQKTFR